MNPTVASLKRAAQDVLPGGPETKKPHIESTIDNRVNTLRGNIHSVSEENPYVPVELGKKLIFVEKKDLNRNSFQAYYRCLENGDSYPILTPKNYKGIDELAKKYEVSWLIDDCEKFYDIYKLDQAIRLGNSEHITSSLVNLIRKKIQLCPEWNDILRDLADKYQLPDLQLYAYDFDLDILPDNMTISVRVNGATEESIWDIKECLSMKNSWHMPKIELLIEYVHDEIVEFKTLNTILKSGFPASTRVVYWNDWLRDDLNEVLHQNPNIENLELLFHTSFLDSEKNEENLIKLIKENQSLGSLCIIFTNSNYSDMEDFDPYRITDAAHNSQIEIAIHGIGYKVDPRNMGPCERTSIKMF